MALETPATPDDQTVAAPEGAAQRFGLRAHLRRIALDRRSRLCGATVISEFGAAVIFTGQPGAWRGRWTGVLACGRIWTCPVCSAKLRVKRLARAHAAMKSLRGRWQMMNLTIRHHAGDDLQPLMRGLLRALARMRRHRAVGAIWKRAVTASIRATEVTLGVNGWHPHLHVLLRMQQLTSAERTTLRHAWRDAVTHELGERHAPTLARGVRLSRALDIERTKPDRLAGYLVKLGCEIAGVAKAPRADGSLTSWDVAALATKREAEERAWAAWSEFQTATKGRRMIELDDRAARAAKGAVIMPFDVEIQCGGDDSPPPVRREVEISSDELRALRRMERVDRFALIRPLLAGRTAHDPVAAVREVVESALAQSVPGYGEHPPPEQRGP